MTKSDTKVEDAAPMDDKEIIAELRKSNQVLTDTMSMLATSQSKLIADAPKDQTLELRRPEDILYPDDDFDTIEDKWKSIIKKDGTQLYNVLMKPWANQSKSEHAFVVCGLTAAEIFYFHNLYDVEHDISKGTTKAIIEVIKVAGLVCDIDQTGVYEAMRSTVERGSPLFNQKLVDRLYTDERKIPRTVEDVTKLMPSRPDAKGIYGITLDKTIHRTLVDKVVKLDDGGMLSIKYYEDLNTRTSGAGVLWRKTGIMGG